MGRENFKLKNWPFPKGERVQLIWIGEPFKYNNKWMIDTYFCDGKETKKVIQDWANIHFLSIDKFYSDGDLNSGEIIDKKGDVEIIDVDLSFIKPKYNESDWKIMKSIHRSKSKTFNFYKNGFLYSIPIVEIVRSVLAPNTFMLNIILYNDGLEDYLSYEVNENRLNLYFTNEYKKSYLKEEYISHLSWILGNKEILNMVSNIGYNTTFKNKILFDFLLKEFKFKARVKKNNNRYTILEIINLKAKKINFNEIKVFHPSFERYEISEKSKIRTFIRFTKGSDRLIDGELSGSTKSDEEVNGEILIHEYVNNPNIIREKMGYKEKRESMDDNTKNFVLDNENKRTLASEGGQDLAKGLAISNSDIKDVNGELKEFQEVLNYLRKMQGISNVVTEIILLPLGRKFSLLSDGITRRKALIATVVYYGKVIKIVEVEREKKSLSTLILKLDREEVYLDKKIKWLLKELIFEGGSWTSCILNNLEKENVKISKYKHLNKKNYDRAWDLYSKIKK